MKRRANLNTPPRWNKRWKDIVGQVREDGLVKGRLRTVGTLIPDGVTVLDIAGGPGLIRPFLKGGVRYTPHDFSGLAVRLAGTPGIVSDCRKIPVGDHSYHTVLALEILEHLDNPGALVTEALRIAQEQVIFSVPDDRWPPEEAPFHRRVYTQASLLSLLVRFVLVPNITFHVNPTNLIAECRVSDTAVARMRSREEGVERSLAFVHPREDDDKGEESVS